MPIPIEAYRLRAGLLRLNRGLYVLRFEAASSVPVDPAFFIVSPAPDCVSHVSMFSSQDDHGNMLRAPGDVLIVKARADIQLVLTTGTSGSIAASPPQLKVERLDSLALSQGGQGLPAQAAALDIIDVPSSLPDHPSGTHTAAADVPNG
jgi:hypothetical protein